MHHFAGYSEVLSELKAPSPIHASLHESECTVALGHSKLQHRLITDFIQMSHNTQWVSSVVSFTCYGEYHIPYC